MNDADPRLELLRRRYAHSFPAKRAALADAWRAFVAAPDDAACGRELSMQVHRLCGSAGAYGYARLGERACAADRFVGDELAAARVGGAARVQRFEPLVRAVLDELANAAACDPLRTLRIVLVGDDPVQATRAAVALQAHGCDVRVEPDGDALRQALDAWSCDAVVFDDRLRSETVAGLVAALRREPQFARLALLCCGVDRDAHALSAMREAGCAVVAGDAGAERLLAAVREALAGI